MTNVGKEVLTRSLWQPKSETNAGERKVASRADHTHTLDGLSTVTATGVTGDILYFNGTLWVVLGIGAANAILKTDASAAAPAWSTKLLFDDSAGRLAVNIADYDYAIGFAGSLITVGNTAANSQVFLGQSATANANIVWVYNATESAATFTFGTRTANPTQIKANNNIWVTVDANGNVVIGAAQLADAATNGFFWIPTTTAGAPSGVPAGSYSGRVPMVYDDTNNAFYIYNAGWQKVGYLASSLTQYLLVADIDDTPVNGEVAQPISSNWAFDHGAAADPHTGYRLESADHTHASTGAQAGQLGDSAFAAGALTNASFANRTRRIQMEPYWNIRTGAAVAFATDAHGGLNSSTNLHIDQADADAAHKQIVYYPRVVPSDYVAGTVNLLIKWSAAAAGNAVFNLFSAEVGDADTAPTTLLNASATVLAAPAVANTIEVSTVALTTNPTADHTIGLRIDMASDHANDTIGNSRTIWDVWLEYTADS